MSKDDKGCCCLCPAYVGVIILGVLQFLSLVDGLYKAFTMGEETKSEYMSNAIWYGIGLLPFLAVWIWKESVCARLTLFIYYLIGFCGAVLVFILFMAGVNIAIIDA